MFIVQFKNKDKRSVKQRQLAGETHIIQTERRADKQRKRKTEKKKRNDKSNKAEKNI